MKTKNDVLLLDSFWNIGDLIIVKLQLQESNISFSKNPEALESSRIFFIAYEGPTNTFDHMASAIQ